MQICMLLVGLEIDITTFKILGCLYQEILSRVFTGRSTIQNSVKLETSQISNWQKNHNLLLQWNIK